MSAIMNNVRIVLVIKLLNAAAYFLVLIFFVFSSVLNLMMVIALCGLASVGEPIKTKNDHTSVVIICYYGKMQSCGKWLEYYSRI